MPNFLRQLALQVIPILLLACLGFAQESKNAKRFDDIPKDSIGLLSFDLGKMKASKEFQLWPWEVIEFAAIEQLGVELEKIESIDMVVLMPTTDFEYGFSIRTKVPYELSALPDQSLSPVEKMTKDPSWSFRDVISEPTIRIMQQEPTRILLGTQGTLRRMTSSRLQTGGEFVGMVEKSQAILRIAVNIDPVRDAITDFILTEENGLTKDLIDELKQIIAQTDDALIELYPDGTNTIAMSFGVRDEEKMEILKQSLLGIQNEVVEALDLLLSSNINRDATMSVGMKQAFRAYLDRLRKILESGKLWTVQDNRLGMKVDSAMLSNYQIMVSLVSLLRVYMFLF